MENFPAIRADEIKEETSAIRPVRKKRMKKKVTSWRRGPGRLKRWNNLFPVWVTKAAHEDFLAVASSDQVCKRESNAKHCHMVFICLNTSLLTTVALKFQALYQDPFKTLAQNAWSFVIAILIYSLAFAMKLPRNRGNNNLKKILDRVLLASGVVSSLSLLSLLLPHLCGLVVLYISWALFVVVSALPLLQRAYNGLLTAITTVIDFVKKKFNGSNSSQQQSSPQQTRPEQPTPQEIIPSV